MSRYVPILLLLFTVAACNDSKDQGILSQPPYDKLTDSIANDPGNADMYYRRGSLLYHNNQKNYAEQDLRKAWQLDPSEGHAVDLTAILREKHTDSAITFLSQQALVKLPGSIPLSIALARGYQQKGQPEKALGICNDVLAKYPGQLDALELKSFLLKELKREAEAIAVLEEAYSFAPDDVALVHTLAFDYAEAKNPKVLALSDSLIHADTENRHAEPFYFKGLYYENTGNTREAIRNFDEAIRRDYNFIDAHMDKGQTFYNAKRYPEALQAFNLALTITPTFPDGYYWVGKTLEAMGNKADAKLNYQRAYGLDKEMMEAKEAADRL